MNATISDVAQKAGVSIALVSRYINNKPGVSEESRNKIKAAIAELNYVPNRLAQCLVTQKTHTIGVLMELLDSDVATALMRGLELGALDDLEGEQYTLIYTNSFGNVERKKKQLNYLTQGRADGVIVFGSQISNDDLMIRLAQTNFPIVLIENDLSAALTDCIIVDSVGGAMAAVQRLIDSGRRHIAHISGEMNLKVTTDRLQGYINALQKNGLPVERNLLAFPDYCDLPVDTHQPIGWEKAFFRHGYEEMMNFLNAGVEIDALFVPTDFIGFGAEKAIEEAGLRVPEDIAIIGFDDEVATAARLRVPPLSSMKQPLEEVGRKAIQLCLKRIENPNRSPEKIVLETEYIDRGTV